MKFIQHLLKKDRRLSRRESSFQLQQEQMKKIGREQFETLLNRGLDVPVALL